MDIDRNQSVHIKVPTGWKFFGNLMDAGMCSVCGEESFGTGRLQCLILICHCFGAISSLL